MLPLLALQHTDGGDVREMGLLLHPFPRPAPPGNDERGGGGAIPFPFRQQSARGSVETQGGIIGFVVFLRQGPRDGFAVDEGDRPTPHQKASSGGLVTG